MLLKNLLLGLEGDKFLSPLNWTVCNIPFRAIVVITDVVGVVFDIIVYELGDKDQQQMFFINSHIEVYEVYSSNDFEGSNLKWHSRGWRNQD